MAKPDELEKLREAFVPKVTISGFQDLGEVIVAKVEQEFPRLGTNRTYRVVMNKKSGELHSLGWLLDK